MKRTYLVVMVLLAMVFGYGCEGQDEETINHTAPVEEVQTASIGVRVNMGDEADGRMLNALGTVDDIVEITVDAALVSDDTVLTSATLEQIDGIWAGTLTELPYDVSIKFTAQALDAESITIFRGTLTQTLVEGADNSIVISLSSVDDGVDPDNPVIASVSMPEKILIDSDPQRITLEIDHSASVAYELSVTSGGIAAAFDGTPSGSLSGVHDPTGSLAFFYTAPSAAGVAQLTVTIRELDSSDEVGANYFLTIVSYDPETWTDSDVTVVVGPAITDMSFVRSETTLKVTVTTDPESGLSYEWTGTGDFADLNESGNPIFITAFDDSKSGSIQVTVTEENNLQAFVSRTIQAGDYPYTVIDYYADMPGLYIFDETTQLMWQDNTNKIKRKWADAGTFCAELNVAGYATWRLPTQNELVNMFERRADFSSYETEDYWSADEDAVDSGNAYVVSYADGSAGIQSKNRKELVRCVRD